MTNGPAPQVLPAPIALWAQHRAATGIRPGTVSVQCCYVARLARHFDLDTVTTEQIVEWLADHPHWQASSRKSAVGSLRMYFRWAKRSGRRADDPAEFLDPVRTPPPCPRPVPEAMLAQALARATDPDTRLMVLAAAYAGMRRSEIAALHTDDLDGDLLRINGKGGKTRVVPIGGALLDELQRRPSGYVFPGRFDGHIGRDLVGHRLSGVLPAGWTGHKFRHRYASRIYSSTRDLLSLQALLGHSSPTTTRAYVLTDLDQLRRAAATALD